MTKLLSRSNNRKIKDDRILIRNMINQMGWSYVSSNMELSEEFIREFADKLDWGGIVQNGWIRRSKTGISACQVLSESFMKEFIHKLDWKMISRYQTLSETFINMYSDSVHWNYISMYQALTIPFIRKHKNRLLWCVNIKRCIKRDQAKKQLLILFPTDIATHISTFL